MKCPKCNEESFIVDVRVPKDIKYTVHRKYLCENCGFTFKTSEKILFTTLPIEIRQQYLDGGYYK